MRVKFSGKQLFDLGLSNLAEKPLALSFIGLNKIKSHELADLIAQYPDEQDWLPIWLERENHPRWLEYYRKSQNYRLEA